MLYIGFTKRFKKYLFITVEVKKYPEFYYLFVGIYFNYLLRVMEKGYFRLFFFQIQTFENVENGGNLSFRQYESGQEQL